MKFRLRLHDGRAVEMAADDLVFLGGDRVPVSEMPVESQFAITDPIDRARRVLARLVAVEP